MKTKSYSARSILLIITLISLTLSCQKDDEVPMEIIDTVEYEVYASGLVSPQGIEMDDQGRIWVCEQGTGNNDGSISMIDKDGKIHPFLIDIPSKVEENRPGSVHHILIDNQTMWAVLGTVSNFETSQLLKLDISDFKAGDSAQKMHSDFVVADIASLVLSYPFEHQSNETNVHNLAAGPDGKIYLVDAAANALLEYNDNTSQLKVLTEFRQLNNSTSVGPPKIDVVPTGIVYHQGNIFVSSLGGFPFNPDDSRIYEVTIPGDVSTVYSGLHGAVDLMVDGQDLVIAEFGVFNMGFLAKTSRLSRLRGTNLEVIADELNGIGGVCKGNNGHFYITQMNSGDVLEIRE